jgi:hypothetical protein
MDARQECDPLEESEHGPPPTDRPPSGCTNLNVNHAEPLYVANHGSHSRVCDFLVSPTGFEPVLLA